MFRLRHAEGMSRRTCAPPLRFGDGKAERLGVTAELPFLKFWVLGSHEPMGLAGRGSTGIDITKRCAVRQDLFADCLWEGPFPTIIARHSFGVPTSGKGALRCQSTFACFETAWVVLCRRLSAETGSRRRAQFAIQRELLRLHRNFETSTQTAEAA